MFLLRILVLTFLCGRMMTFLLQDVDTQDTGALGLMEDLDFIPVATSENILFTADKIRVKEDCDNEIIGWCSSLTDTDPVINFVFPKAMVIKSLTLESTSVSCIRAQTSDDMERFELQYLDPAAQFQTYDTNITGPKLGDGGRIIYDLVPTIYTRMLKIVPSKAGECFALTVTGSEGTEMCSNITCKNGGECSGINQCSCPRGFIGRMCKVTAESVETNSFDFLSESNGTIFTPDANFSITGNVDLSNVKTRRFLNIGHFLQCGFHGVSSAIHQVFGHGHHHHCLFEHVNPYHGFTHSFQVRFGHHHHQTELVHLLSYNPWHFSKHNTRVHCYFQKGRIHCSVTHSRHVYSLNTLFSPIVHHDYNIVLSFGLPQGISLFNGTHFASQTRPTTNPPAHTAPNHHGLCIGICGAPLSHPINMGISNIVSVALNHAALALNGLSHLMSPGQSHTKLPPTTSTSTTTMVTQTPVTTTTKAQTSKVFTSQPTTIRSPVTATTMLSTTTAAGTGPLCYSCSQLATDGSCKAVSRCQANEVCVLYKDANGYTHKCLDQQVCTQAKQLMGTVCWICCTGSLCNDRCSASPTTTKPPCVDNPTCPVLQSTGFNVCSNPTLAAAHCRKTCHICI